MSLIVAINSGSSSLRLAAYAVGDAGTSLLAKESHGRIEQGHTAVLERFLDTHRLRACDAIAHRIVHGGAYAETSRIDGEVERGIQAASRLAPLHNPLALIWIEATRAVLGAALPQIAVFDTAYFNDLPEPARRYPLPSELCEKHGIRRYGFHGIAHQAMGRAYRALGGVGRRVISLQLGSGCSVAAVLDGRPQDTSMGFSPLEGLMMATRCGDLDPGLLLYLQQAEGWSPAQLEALLNKECGLKGVSGIGGDMRELLASDAPAARLAVEMFCHRVRKYIGAYAAVLGGVDAILFGGGIGENAATIREEILRPLDWLGARLDPQANASATGCAGRITCPGSQVEAWVVPVDEAAVIAVEAGRLLRSGPGQ